MLRRLLAALREAIMAAPVRVLIGSGLVAVLAFVLGVGVEFRTSRSELAPPDDPEQQRFERLMQEVGGSSVLIVCIEPNGQHPGVPREIREFTDALAAELEADPLVGRVFYRVPLDWFLEHALYLVPEDTLRQINDQLHDHWESLAFVEKARSLVDLNNELASGLESGLRGTGTVPPGAASGVSYLQRLVEGERRFLEDPEGYAAHLESRPALLALVDRPVLAAEGYITTHDGTKMFIIVSPADGDDSLPSQRRFVASLRARAQAVSAARPGFRVAFTGQPAMTVEEMDTVRRDTWFTSVVAIVGVTLLTLFVFRWRTHAFLVLGVLAVGILWSLGAVRLELGYLNLITSSFLSTLIGVGVAYLIHPVSEYELEGAHSVDPVKAVREAYHRTGAPVTVAAVTTSAAFFSILLMRFRGFAELGLVAGVGVILCLIASLVTLPAVLVIYGRRRHRRDRDRREGSASAAVDRFWVERGADQVCRLPRTVTVAALLITAGLGWTARDIGFNTNLLDLLPRNSEALRYQRRMVMESDLSPVANMALAANLGELERMQAAARAEPTIRRFESVLQFLPRDPDGSRREARRLGTLVSHLRLPEETEALDRPRLEASLERLEDALARAAESAFGAGLGELAGALEQTRAAAEAAGATAARAPQGVEATWDRGQRRLLRWLRGLQGELRRAAAADPPRIDELPREIRERFVTPEGRLIAYLQPEGNVFDPQVLSRYVQASRRVSGEITGFPIVFDHVSTEITSGFYRAIAVGSILVLAILLVDYRNVRDAALAVVPLVMGVVWMLGFMGLLGLSFNFANLVAVPLIIGVGIDNGVHVVHRVRLEGQDGMTVVLRHTVRAILIASLTTMIGFGSLGLASHQGLASLGKVLLLGVGSCLVTATVILPNMLVAFGKTRR